MKLVPKILVVFFILFMFFVYLQIKKVVMSEYTIVVNTRTKLTKSLVDMALSLSKLSKHVRVFDEKIEDKALATLMQKSLKSKRVSRDEVFKALE